MKAFVFATLVSAITVYASAQNGVTTASHLPHCVMNTEEQAVVVAYFNTPTFSKNLLGIPHVGTMLADETQPGPDTRYLDDANLKLAANERAIPADARADFTKKASGNCAVGKLSALRSVRVISAPKNTSLSTFYRRYGNDAILVRVSRVGFNHNGSVAVMHVSYYARHSGGGCLYVFERNAGHWMLRTQLPTWTT